MSNNCKACDKLTILSNSNKLLTKENNKLKKRLAKLEIVEKELNELRKRMGSLINQYEDIVDKKKGK